MDTVDIEYTLSNKYDKKQKAMKTDESAEKRQKMFIRLFEVLILTPAILIIIGLLSLPTVFYALPDETTVSFMELVFGE